MRPVLLATCSGFPAGDADDALLLAALERAGVRASWVVWDDPSIDWTGALTVLRSTWDYTLRRAAFLDWVRSVDDVHNPARIVAWNSDKTYLLELERAGVPVTPTTAFAPGERPLFPTDHEFVVKPSVGAGSRGAGRFLPSSVDAAASHAADLHAAGRTALVQPYLTGVDEAGETAMLFFGGSYSHAIRKGPMLRGSSVYSIDESRGLFVEENISARTASPAELALGEQALAFLTERFGAAPLYARVDVLPGPDGPVIVELELTEPSLFFAHAEGSADTFAAAVATAL